MLLVIEYERQFFSRFLNRSIPAFFQEIQSLRDTSYKRQWFYWMDFHAANFLA